MGPVSIGVEVQRNTDGDTPSSSIGARSVLLAGDGSLTMFMRKSLDKRAAVFA